jgi:hypothetical protein
MIRISVLLNWCHLGCLDELVSILTTKISTK